MIFSNIIIYAVWYIVCKKPVLAAVEDACVYTYLCYKVQTLQFNMYIAMYVHLHSHTG